MGISTSVFSGVACSLPLSGVVLASAVAAMTSTLPLGGFAEVASVVTPRSLCLLVSVVIRFFSLIHFCEALDIAFLEHKGPECWMLFQQAPMN